MVETRGLRGEVDGFLFRRGCGRVGGSGAKSRIYVICSQWDSTKIPIGASPDFRYLHRMSQVAELLKEASKLDPLDRAELVSSLLEDLDPSPHLVTDEEVLRRLEDLKSGRVKGLSEEEFWKACGRS